MTFEKLIDVQKFAFGKLNSAWKHLYFSDAPNKLGTFDARRTILDKMLEVYEIRQWLVDAKNAVPIGDLK